ncbi:MAG: hypothetical protein KDI36_01350 [Pseudomonadales bacterium]|nr:hypothetical protein [Pseudomonadales bacterium]
MRQIIIVRTGVVSLGFTVLLSSCQYFSDSETAAPVPEPVPMEETSATAAAVTSLEQAEARARALSVAPRKTSGEEKFRPPLEDLSSMSRESRRVLVAQQIEKLSAAPPAVLKNLQQLDFGLSAAESGKGEARPVQWQDSEYRFQVPGTGEELVVKMIGLGAGERTYTGRSLLWKRQYDYDFALNFHYEVSLGEQVLFEATQNIRSAELHVNRNEQLWADWFNQTGAASRQVPLESGVLNISLGCELPVSMIPWDLKPLNEHLCLALAWQSKEA